MNLERTMKMDRILYEIKEWAIAIVMALAAAILIHAFICQPTRVSGESMENTLRNGEYLFVSKIMHDLREVPNYEDIVIIDSRVRRERTWKDDLSEPLISYMALFNKNLQSHSMWVKRVIGRPGDVLEFKDNAVWRNGVKLKENYIKEEMNYNLDYPITVPEGTVFVMGDNRNHSADSRFIGPVPIDHVLGRVIF